MSAPSATDWRPTATRPVLAQRAQLLARTRHFFARRAVLEVDTPVVVNCAVTDVHLHCAQVRFAERPERAYFLHTSPEYAMKRLLAAGSGDIYQICHVIRGFERGPHHNAEFTLIEWYRLGFSLDALMDEVEALVRDLLGKAAASLAGERISYRELFMRELHFDPLTAQFPTLAEAARGIGFDVGAQDGAGQDAEQRDELLELLMGARIGPKLGRDALTFVYGYPASQAALACLDPDDPRIARRFELYCRGIELANGFQELCCAAQQRARFQRDNAERRRRALPDFAPDERLLAALESGLPECSGVALGFDRLLMLASAAAHIDDVLPFSTEQA
ncbi:MAG TPA: EF-P lysine aminoacylase EpmA [Steroidobacteraceae bacterium]